ncbi:MAG: DUF3343 domain-containing protein [Bacteroidetes bacterium]|nr:DUF3343 domain-containing protein [Bacteroidota bacterium]MBT6687428.1 DUF3343 domain-containing protein [Bacteroidota bacterium]MBT7144888.1 DUF3343 domain-containing protein [Bacteroidota bacterium]MBT7493338.1 DUF3343 domain-containing protein [Bacteroidota bacterium]
MGNEIVLIFESIHKVLKAEKLLIEAKLKLEIIPTPRDLSSNCGMAIRLKKDENNINKIGEILEKFRIAYKIFDR